MDSQVKQSLWEPIESFASLGEFNRFVAWMNDQIKNGFAVETAVISPYLDATTFDEKWFKNVETGKVWRLVGPDGPFYGLFEKVS